MKHRFKRNMLIAACMMQAAAVPADPNGKPTKPPIPRSCAGITIAGSTDSGVQKLYGKGYFVANESHARGRYYIDPGHHVTLHIEIGVDHVIDGVEYREGMHLPGTATARMLKAAETQRLTGAEKIDGVVSLGATPHDVRARYGKPTHESVEGGVRIVDYRAESPSSVPYDVNFDFPRGRLVRVYFDVGD